MKPNLLLPIDGRGGRGFLRATGCSAALHAGAVFLLLMPSASTTVPSPRAQRPPSPVMKTDMRAFVAPPPAPATQTMADRTPRAPKPPRLENPTAGPGARVARVEAPPTRLLKLAVQLRQADATTPGYTIENLSIDILRAFVERGWGRVVCGRPPFADAVEVSWTDAAPVVRPVTGNLRGDVLSQRALSLPASIVANIVGPDVAGRTGAFLLLTRAADAVVLASQIQSAEAANIRLNDVVRTVGAFAFSGGEFAGLRITELDLVDGRVVRLPRS